MMIKLFQKISIWSFFLASTLAVQGQNYERIELCPDDSIQFNQGTQNRTVWYFKGAKSTAYVPFEYNSIFNESGLVYGISYIDSCSYVLSDTLEIVKYHNLNKLLGNNKVFPFPWNGLPGKNSRPEQQTLLDTITLEDKSNEYFTDKNRPDSIILEVLGYDENVLYSQNLLQDNRFVFEPEYLNQHFYLGNFYENYYDIYVRERYVYNDCQVEFLSKADTVPITNTFYASASKNDDSLSNVTFFIGDLSNGLEAGTSYNDKIGIGNFSGKRIKDMYVSVAVMYDSLNELYPGIYIVMDSFLTLDHREVVSFNTNHYWPDFIPEGKVNLRVVFVDTLNQKSTEHIQSVNYSNFYTDSLEYNIIPLVDKNRKLPWSQRRSLPLKHQIINNSPVRRHQLYIEAFLNDDTRPDFKYTTGYIEPYDTFELVRMASLYSEDSMVYQSFVHHSEEDSISAIVHKDDIFSDEEPLYLERLSIKTPIPNTENVWGTASLENRNKARTVYTYSMERGLGKFDTLVVELHVADFNRDVENETIRIDLLASSKTQNEKLLDSITIQLVDLTHPNQLSYLDSNLLQPFKIAAQELTAMFPNEEEISFRFNIDVGQDLCLDYNEGGLSRGYRKSYYDSLAKTRFIKQDAHQKDTFFCTTCTGCFDVQNFIQWKVKLDTNKDHLPYLEIWDRIQTTKISPFLQKEGDTAVFSIPITNFGQGESDSTTVRINWVDQKAYYLDKTFRLQEAKGSANYYPIWHEDFKIPPIKAGDTYKFKFQKILNDSSYYFFTSIDPYNEKSSLVKYLHAGPLLGQSQRQHGTDYCNNGVGVLISKVEYYIDSTWHLASSNTLPNKVEFADGEKIRTRIALRNIGSVASRGTEIGLRLSQCNPKACPTAIRYYYENPPVKTVTVQNTILPHGSVKNGKWVKNDDIVVEFEYKLSDLIKPGERFTINYQVDPNGKHQCFTPGGSLWDYTSDKTFSKFRVAQTDVELEDLEVPTTFECGKSSNVKVTVNNKGSAAVLQKMDLKYNDNAGNNTLRTINSLQKNQSLSFNFPVKFEPVRGTLTLPYSSETTLDLSNTNSVIKVRKQAYNGDVNITYRTGNIKEPTIIQFTGTKLSWNSTTPGSGTVYYYEISSGYGTIHRGKTTGLSVSFSDLGYGSFSASVYATDGRCKMSNTAEASYEKKLPPPPPTKPPKNRKEIEKEKETEGGSSGGVCPLELVDVDKHFGRKFSLEFHNKSNTNIVVNIGIKNRQGTWQWYEYDESHPVLANGKGLAASSIILELPVSSDGKPITEWRASYCRYVD